MGQELSMVYRVEQRITGRGPYVGAPDGLWEALTRNINEKRHPSAWSWIQKHGRQFICGFRDKAQYDRWFNGKKKVLRSWGYVLRVYESDTVIDCDQQVIFIKGRLIRAQRC